MAVFLYLMAIIELLGGIPTFFVATTVIHEILGELMVGFSFLTMGLAAILDQLKRSDAAASKINITS
jgi:hypothetical protein